MSNKYFKKKQNYFKTNTNDLGMAEDWDIYPVLSRILSHAFLKTLKIFPSLALFCRAFQQE